MGMHHFLCSCDIDAPAAALHDVRPGVTRWAGHRSIHSIHSTHVVASSSDTFPAAPYDTWYKGNTREAGILCTCTCAAPRQGLCHVRRCMDCRGPGNPLLTASLRPWWRHPA